MVNDNNIYIYINLLPNHVVIIKLNNTMVIFLCLYWIIEYTMHSYNAGLKLCNRNIWNILNGYGYVHMRRNNIFADIN
jgi:hypothetical protein